MNQNATTLIELFNRVIVDPKIHVCTEDFKGASLLDVNLLRVLRKDHEMPIKKLTMILGVSPSTLGSAIKRLEAKGMISRILNPEDLRSFIIKLTQTGQEAIDELYEGQLVLAEKLLSKLSLEEQASFIAMLKTVFVDD